MVYIERDIEKEIEKWHDAREIVAIRGPRQAGKTTLLRRIEDKLKKKGVDEKNIHYISFENDLDRMKFKKNPKEFINFFLTEKKHYFLLDEVQYVSEVGKHLKLIFDAFDNVKIFITGSSSFDLTNLGQYLVGRVVFFNLLPFSFSEFLKAKDKKYERLYKEIKVDIKEDIKIKDTVFLDDFNRLLHEYLTYGGYPRIVLEKDIEKKKELLKNLFTTYIEHDVAVRYGIKYRENAVRLLKSIAVTSGNMINYETLCSTSGLKYHEVRQILPLLEDSFAIFIVKPFFKNVMNELRKNPKIYFVDYGLKNYLLERFENLEFDSLYENFVHNELIREFKVKFWRTTAKTEVDFVVEHGDEIIPIEVKTKPKIARSFRSFIDHYSSKKAFILNLEKTGMKKIDDCEVHIVPFVFL